MTTPQIGNDFNTSFIKYKVSVEPSKFTNRPIVFTVIQF